MALTAGRIEADGALDVWALWVYRTVFLVLDNSGHSGVPLARRAVACA